MARAVAVWSALVLGLLLAGSVAAAPARGSMTLVFQRTWDGGSMHDLAVGPDDSVYAAGLTPGEEFYPGLFDLDVSVLRWSASGDLLWQVKWRGSGDEDARGLAVDATGAAYITGMTSSFGTYFDAFLVKFDASGNLVWQRTWGGPREDAGTAIAAAPEGGVYVAGVTQSFGSLFGPAAFLLKFTGDGALEWERTWQAPGGTVLEDMEVSADGTVYLVGNTDFNRFLAKFTAGGDLVWDRSFMAPGLMAHTAVFRGIGTAPDGGVVAVGSWMPTFDQDVLIVRFSADGTILWTRDWGGDSHEEGIDAVVGADGTIYVAGHTDTFAQGVYEDVFVLKVLSNGRGSEVRTWGGPNRDRANAIALATNGDLYVAGGATVPPYAFGSAPAQLSRVRGATAVDADAVVSTPPGILGSPTGTTSPLDGTVGTGDSPGAVLLRVRPS